MAKITTGHGGDILLALVGAALGSAAALGYAAWRAVSRTGASSADRWSSFGDAVLFPGLLIVAALTVIVWLGWKANIDG